MSLSSSNAGLDIEKCISIVTEFVESSIHCILKARRIYPDSLFEKVMKYGVSIWRCRHPEVSEYIRKVVHGCHDLIHTVIFHMHIFQEFFDA